MSTSQAIHEHASEQKRLVSALEELNNVDIAITQQTEYLTDLRKQLDDSIFCTEFLTKKVEKERKEHEEYRDSTLRRFTHKLRGKGDQFTEQAEKEEREYVEALQELVSEKERQSQLQLRLEEAERIIKDLERKSSVAASLKVELNRLYKRVFEGPSPEFPEEDLVENEVWETQKAYEQLQETVANESHAAELLSRANEHLVGCSRKLNSHMVLNGQLDDYFSEKKLLVTVQALARNADTLARQACAISPQVEAVTSGPMLTALSLDTLPRKDYLRHIKEISGRVDLVLVPLRYQERAARQRSTTASRKASATQDKLTRIQATLYEIREQTFIRVTSEDHPPDYAPPRSGNSTAPPPIFAEPEANNTEREAIARPDASLPPHWENRNVDNELLPAYPSGSGEGVIPEHVART